MNKIRFLLVLLFLLVLAHSAVPAFSAPKIEIKEKVFNFKETIEGKTVEHTFPVGNLGDQTLEIRRVKPG